MSDAQPYLAIGLPSFVALVGIERPHDPRGRVVWIEDKLGIVPR
jgi:hypothetical protein